MRNPFDRLALCLLCALAASHCGDDDSGGDAARESRESGRSGTADASGTGERTAVDSGATRIADAAAGRDESGGVAADSGEVGRSEIVPPSEPASDSEDDAGSIVDATDSAGPDASDNVDAGGGAEDIDQAAMQCVDDARAGGLTITDCERCLCQTDVCQVEMNAIKSDEKASALVQCSQRNACSGQCCLCGDTCDILNYGNGPCAAEANVAAGVAANSGLEAALTVMRECAETGPDDSACARAARLSACALAKCAEMCPSLPVCE